MIFIVKCLLYISLGLFLHSYILYPIIVGLFYFLQKKKKRIQFTIEDDLPMVFILISVHNEEKIIRQKLESLFQTNYPLDHIQVYVGSDFSNDHTNSILQEFQTKYTNLHALFYNVRRGKPQVLNDLMKVVRENHSLAADRIVLYTDANVILNKDTIYRMVRNFKDPKVGLVDCRMISGDLTKTGVAKSEDNYIRLESRLKQWEGELWGCMMGAFGGCYAVRSNLVCTLPEKILVDDFYISMKVLEQNYFAISDSEALAFESLTGSFQQEFRRKSRISSGNIQNLIFFYKNVLTRPFIENFCFFSHKVIRWIGPVLLVLSILSSFILTMEQKGIHSIVFITLCVVLFLIPWMDRVLMKGGIHWSLFRNISYFSWMNLALLNGLLRYYKGIRSSIWEPTKRT